MANIYDIRRYGTVIFLIVSVVVVAVFLYVSSTLVADLSEQERDRMQIWADATREIINTGSSSQDGSSSNVDFLLSIIERNRNIPVLLTDDAGVILLHRNFDLPEPVDSLAPWEISAVNQKFLNDKLAELKDTPNVIHIIIAPGNLQHLYYEDSKLLKRLSWYPYIQLLVMLAFVIVVYFAVMSTKKAEQNKVWVGLSKETAHQLGTPISSLMAWMEMLPAFGVDADTVAEMDKDVRRLSTIASRFGKVGSRPQMAVDDVVSVVERAASYMATRISSRVTLSVDKPDVKLHVRLSDSLFEWVMENLIKNAVDAMEGHGSIHVSMGRDGDKAYIEVADSGKGIPRKRFKTIFNPGYTTKSRGWGLGLTLAKRIIEQYHGGRIYVKSSEPGVGTTFRIELSVVDGSAGE